MKPKTATSHKIKPATSHKIGRDSRTGEFLSVKEAQRRPSTTVVETIKHLSLKKPSNRQRPALPVYAGKGGLLPTVANTLTHRALLDAADEV